MSDWALEEKQGFDIMTDNVLGGYHGPSSEEYTPLPRPEPLITTLASRLGSAASSIWQFGKEVVDQARTHTPGSSG